MKEYVFIQANLSITYPGIIRALHHHEKAKLIIFHMPQRCHKIWDTRRVRSYSNETMELDEIISAGEELKIVKMLGKFWHGFKTMGDKPAWLLHFVNRLYDYTNPEERRPLDDPKIVPQSIT